MGFRVCEVSATRTIMNSNFQDGGPHMLGTGRARADSVGASGAPIPVLLLTVSECGYKGTKVVEATPRMS